MPSTRTEVGPERAAPPWTEQRVVDPQSGQQALDADRGGQLDPLSLSPDVRWRNPPRRGFFFFESHRAGAEQSGASHHARTLCIIP